MKIMTYIFVIYTSFIVGNIFAQEDGYRIQLSSDWEEISELHAMLDLEEKSLSNVRKLKEKERSHFSKRQNDELTRLDQMVILLQIEKEKYLDAYGLRRSLYMKEKNQMEIDFEKQIHPIKVKIDELNALLGKAKEKSTVQVISKTTKLTSVSQPSQEHSDLVQKENTDGVGLLSFFGKIIPQCGQARKKEDSSKVVKTHPQLANGVKTPAKELAKNQANGHQEQNHLCSQLRELEKLSKTIVSAYHATKKSMNEKFEQMKKEKIERLKDFDNQIFSLSQQMKVVEELLRDGLSKIEADYQRQIIFLEDKIKKIKKSSEVVANSVQKKSSLNLYLESDKKYQKRYAEEMKFVEGALLYYQQMKNKKIKMTSSDLDKIQFFSTIFSKKIHTKNQSKKIEDVATLFHDANRYQLLIEEVSRPDKIKIIMPTLKNLIGQVLDETLLVGIKNRKKYMTHLMSGQKDLIHCMAPEESFYSDASLSNGEEAVIVRGYADYLTKAPALSIGKEALSYLQWGYDPSVDFVYGQPKKEKEASIKDKAYQLKDEVIKSLFPNDHLNRSEHIEIFDHLIYEFFYALYEEHKSMKLSTDMLRIQLTKLMRANKEGQIQYEKEKEAFKLLEHYLQSHPHVWGDKTGLKYKAMGKAALKLFVRFLGEKVLGM